jgi:hypothetical protein
MKNKLFLLQLAGEGDIVALVKEKFHFGIFE